MSDLNYVFLIGRLTADPVVKTAQTGSTYCTFSIANNRRYRKQNGEIAEETSFINCIAWGRLSDIMRNYLKKGMQIAIEGRLRQTSWKNEEGKSQSSVTVVVNNLQILTPRTSAEGQKDAGEPQDVSQLNPILDLDSDTEDDIPF